MLVISQSDYIRCYFDPYAPGTSELHSGVPEVYFAETSDLSSIYSILKNYITEDEQVRADKFIFESDRATYVSCHALLRSLLSRKVNTKPKDISFKTGVYKKPSLTGNPVYFNITHTRESFAIVISGNYEAGIDMEVINKGMNFSSVISTFFSRKERKFILQSASEAPERFFLLWTRKEALLKALGTGIADNLTKIEVSEKDNLLNRKAFDNLIPYYDLKEHFIYSIKFLNYYLSIALPHKTAIKLHCLNNGNIFSFLD